MFWQIAVLVALVPVCFGHSVKLTKCEDERENPHPALDYIPTCDNKGRYRPIQCVNIWSKFCFCVNKKGEEVYGTRRKTKEEVPNCRIRKPSKCELELYEIFDVHDKVARPDDITSSSYTSFKNGGYIPECDPETGKYMPIQCRYSWYASYCFCVRPKNGKEIYGTRRLSRDEIGVCPEGRLKNCQKARYEFLYADLLEDQVAIGKRDHDDDCTIYPPECNKKGKFESVQCNSCECYCVNRKGEKMPGTEGPMGIVQCKNGVRIDSEWKK